MLCPNDMNQTYVKTLSEVVKLFHMFLISCLSLKYCSLFSWTFFTSPSVRIMTQNFVQPKSFWIVTCFVTNLTLYIVTMNHFHMPINFCQSRIVLSTMFTLEIKAFFMMSQNMIFQTMNSFENSIALCTKLKRL